jgi:hypothetical protein
MGMKGAREYWNVVRPAFGGMDEWKIVDFKD